jgi:fatty acid desaturase
MSGRAGFLTNIGRRERRKRLLFGFAGFAAGAALEAALVLRGAPAWWRLGVFVLFWLGALGVMQASGHT